MKKRLLYIVLTCFLFLYGFSIGHFKIFPFQQILAFKHYIEFRSGSFETQERVGQTGDVEYLDTFLSRLLVKKIQLPGYTGHGGGLSVTGEYLYVITNKGSFQIYDAHTLSEIESAVTEVPMNFSSLITSGHPYRNNFRINWFRVNGVLTELTDDRTHRIFISHNAYDSERDCITHNISRAELSVNGDSIVQTADWETIFTASPCIDPEPENLQSSVPYPGHISGGSMIHFDQDHLLASVGDYNRHGIDGADEYAMDHSNPYGKFILVNKNSGEWSVFATGSRNASALYIDRNSLIWSVENGPEGGDELNRIAEGKNYGWPHVSYGLWYNPEYKLPGRQIDGTHPEYQKPIFSWVPAIAPSSLIKIEGTKFELWKDDLLVGTMRDQSLHRLRLDEDNRVVYDERIPVGHRIRDITTLPDDKILLLTDDGYLIVLEDGGAVYQDIDPQTEKLIAGLNDFGRITGDIEDTSNIVFDNHSRVVYEQYCASCHNLNPVHQVGPHLHNLFNRQVGGAENYNYSQTLRSDTRYWSPALLRTFLMNPESEFAGNRMQQINLSSEEADSLLKYFQDQITDE